MKMTSLYVCAVFLSMTIFAQGQIFSPQLQGYFGIGTVFYPYGYYQGQLSNGVAHGAGTFYFQDGTIFQGYFQGGWRNGPGVIINPFYGYISGCWTNGQFIGNCVQQSNPYQSKPQVRKVVEEAIDDFSDDADFSIASSPEGYEIDRIDPSTELGRQLLGNYSGQ